MFSHRPDITALGVNINLLTYLLFSPPTLTPNTRVPTNFSIQESGDKEQTAPFGGGVYLKNLYVVFCHIE